MRGEKLVRAGLSPSAGTTTVGCEGNGDEFDNTMAILPMESKAKISKVINCYLSPHL